MNRKSIYILIVIVVAVGLWFWMNQYASPVVTEGDTTASINQDLNNIAVQDPDFNTIDTDLNSL